MKTIPTIIATIIISLLLMHSASARDVYPMYKSNVTELREDLPSYVFEYDLERLYPATWEFYKKLDLIKRDTVYSNYLYHPSIKEVRHQIFKLALAKDKGKTRPAPTSFNQVLTADSNPTSATSRLNLGRVHSITKGPTIRAIKFNSYSHQSVYSFLENNR